MSPILIAVVAAFAVVDVLVMTLFLRRRRAPRPRGLVAEQIALVEAAPPPAPGDEVATLLAQGRKLEAIKAYRAATGVGLAEAKDAVEALEPGAVALPVAPASAEAAVLEAEVLELVRADRMIEAIKAYRAATGVGLAEAKGAVEAIARRGA